MSKCYGVLNDGHVTHTAWTHEDLLKKAGCLSPSEIVESDVLPIIEVIHMNSPIWQAASGIDDQVEALRTFVDQAELSPSPGRFHLIRQRLSDIGHEAEFIMIQTKNHKFTVIDFVKDDLTEQPAISPHGSEARHNPRLRHNLNRIEMSLHSRPVREEAQDSHVYA